MYINVTVFNRILNRYGIRAFIAHTYAAFIAVICSVFFTPTFVTGSFILPTPYTKILFLDTFVLFFSYLNSSIFAFGKYG